MCKSEVPKVSPNEDLLGIYEDILRDNDRKDLGFLRIGLWILEMQ